MYKRQVIWGASFDEELKEKVKITLIATGFEVSDIPGMPVAIAKAHPHKPTTINSEPSSFFNFGKKDKKEDETETESDDEEPEALKPDIDKTFNEYYVNSLHPDPEKVPELEPELFVEPVVETEPEPQLEYPVINLDDLDDESTLKKVVNIPAWKRRLMK